MKAIVLLLAFSFHTVLFSQSNVRAWYADGQVWVVWNVNLPVAETCGIYASPSPFTNTANATLLGRPFHFEYLGAILKDNMADNFSSFRIPDGQGGQYQLDTLEALFVFTPHQAGALYFAVTPWGSPTVSAGQNITSSAVAFAYNPGADPVESHVQAVFPSPFAAGYTCIAYCLWVDGRQNHWEGRPDFPIMANAAKNGMPALFMVSIPHNLDTSQAFPLSVWLHGGGGRARQSLAGSRAEVNIEPKQGILVSHQDEVTGYRDSFPPHLSQPSWHYGWRKNYNPFQSGNLPTAPDTVVNYVQRRYIWVDQWLSRKLNIDTTRIQIHGHSMGSAGALALSKCYPEHYASVTLFNTGCAGPESNSPTVALFGETQEDYPTNLINRNGETVVFRKLWNLTDNCAPQRDFPLIRHWHGKNDDNGTMRWSPIVVENYRITDSTGAGIQNYWSERGHGMDTGPSYNDHWISGIPANQQTVTDNVAYAEALFRSNQSLPVFFNHRLDPKNNDPGTGLIGINNGDGDNWGTWGGYHRWSNTEETPIFWQTTAWLTANSVFPNDNCPHDFLTADLAIRRPQSFLPETGKMLAWNVKDAATGAVLQNGMTTVQADNLVVIPQIAVYRETIRKVRITIVNSALSSSEHGVAELQLVPNPTTGLIRLPENTRQLRLFDWTGQLVLEQNPDTFARIDQLPAGMYFVEVVLKNGARRVGRLMKI